MPTYEFRCETCQTTFTRLLPMNERYRTEMRCPQCGGEQVIPLISTFAARTSRKS
jgi:putative FmdB family regulatory protein